MFVTCGRGGGSGGPGPPAGAPGVTVSEGTPSVTGSFPLTIPYLCLGFYLVVFKLLNLSMLPYLR